MAKSLPVLESKYAEQEGVKPPRELSGSRVFPIPYSDTLRALIGITAQDVKGGTVGVSSSNSVKGAYIPNVKPGTEYTTTGNRTPKNKQGWRLGV
jgi:hypothetical protein